MTLTIRQIIHLCMLTISRMLFCLSTNNRDQLGHTNSTLDRSMKDFGSIVDRSK